MSERKSPKLRFPGFTDDWEQRKFGEVFDGLQNNTLSRAELNYENGSVMNVHYGDVLIKYGDYIDASSADLPYITDEAIARKFSSSFLQDGDIIIADTAEDETVGKCSEIVGSDGIKLLSGLHTIACRPKQKYAPKFLGYYINSDAYHRQLLPLMQGIKVTSISKSALQNTDMILPKSFDEQAKIGEYFSNLDNLITLHQRKCDAIREYKKGMLQKMFPKDGESVPEIRFPGFTDDWEQRKFGDLADYKKGPFGSAITKDMFVPKSSDSVKVYEQQNAINKDWSLERYFLPKEYASTKLKSFETHGGDIIVSCAGTIGEIYEIPENAESGIINQALMRVRIKQDVVDKKMFIIVFSNMIDSFTRIHSNGSAIKNIPPFADLKPMEVLMPSFEEQRKISGYFDNLDNLITLHQRKCDKLKELKKGLLQQMFV